jgi:Phospholipase_D-nuclease N-terminal
VFFLFFLMFSGVLALVGTGFWIWMLVDCINNKGLTDTTKAVWVLFIVFTHFLGAFFYLILGRKPERAIVYQYQQQVPFQQPMGGMYQQGNVPYNGNPPYQAPFPPPMSGAPNAPHTLYNYQAPQYPPAYRPGNAQGEYIPYEMSSKPASSPSITPQPSYQEGYVPQPPTSEGPRASTHDNAWPKEDEPQAIYPDLPQQTQRQQPNQE